MENMMLEYREGYKAYKDFTGLICWQDCREVKLFFYKEILPMIPPEEKFNLDIQIRKSARSITANIAEGSGRHYYQEAIQYLRISRGSLHELKDDLIFCKDLNYISESLFRDGLVIIEKAKASTSGFIKYMQKKKDQVKTSS